MFKNNKSFALLIVSSIILSACFGPVPGSQNGMDQNTPGGNQEIPSQSVVQTSADVSNGEIQVVISGGHETDPGDNGRPVVLIASMLGVPPEIFREAFSHVSPASAGTEPNAIQVKLNKDALLNVLGPYGVTNDHLDEVSNYYRYNPSAGEVWTQTQGTAEVVMTDGVVTGIKITNPGSGYSSVPVITILNSDLTATATLTFTTNFSTNGSISSITLDQ